jgi:hypothetical protein
VGAGENGAQAEVEGGDELVELVHGVPRFFYRLFSQRSP